MLASVARDLEANRARMKMMDDSALEGERSIAALKLQLEESKQERVREEQAIQAGEVQCC